MLVPALVCFAWLGFLDPVPADDLKTVAERSGYRATSRSEEVEALCRKIAATSKTVHLDSLGTSGEGKSIPLLILADPPVRTPEEAARSGKLVIFLFGNIHAGEVDGKEALLRLTREVAADPKHPWLKSAILAIVPNLNPDGNDRMSKDNRPGQDGPVEGMGQRGNAAGLDLNRDFMKLETPEIRALVRFLNKWDPHLTIDTHTTNGSFHRYLVTYAGPKHPAGSSKIISYVRKDFLPEVSNTLAKLDPPMPTFFYGNFEKDHTLWTTYPAEPRYGITYIGLRNRLAILSESYSHAPYKDRVLGSHAFVKACVDRAVSQADAIKTLLREAASTSARPNEIAVRSEAKPFPEKVKVLGYVEERSDGRLRPTQETKDYEAEFVDDFAPTLSVKLPTAYLIPRTFGGVVETLQRHGILVDELREDIELDVEVDRVTAIRRSPMAFQKHRMVDADVTARPESRRVEAGTWLVRTDQARGVLAAELLEPRAEDSLLAWNAFDSALSEGSDLPVLRLKDSTPVRTVAARPLADDRPKGKTLRFSDVSDSPRGGGGFGGPFTAALSRPTWLDDDHFLENRSGRMYKVNAVTGRMTPFADPAPMTKALAALPAIGATRAGGLARSALSSADSFRGGAVMDPTRVAALFDVENDLYYARVDGTRAVRLTSSPQQEDSPKFSPDGRFVAYLRGNDLWVVDVETRTDRALTSDGSATILNGRASWVYYEEIFNRNEAAFWWSPDSKAVAFLRFDDSPVKPYTVVDDVGGRQAIEQARYPVVGDPNPLVKLGIVSASGGEPKYADLSDYQDGHFLISRVEWRPDSKDVIAHVQDRTQTWLDNLAVPADGSAPRRLFRETTKAWVESTGESFVLEDGSFLVLSDRSGWRHIDLHGKDGTLVRAVTQGPWDVRDIHHVDAKGGYVYFTGTKDRPLGPRPFRVKLAGGEPQSLNDEAGGHRAAFNPSGTRFIDQWSSHAEPEKMAVFAADGAKLRTLDTNPLYAREEYRFAPFALVDIPARDGTTLHGELTLPLDLDPRKSYPVWISTYAGPRFPNVSDAWRGGRTRDQMYANEGMIVFSIDPRSASNQGSASAWTAYRKLGVQELADLEDAVKWLCNRPYVDPSRIGLTGHSYGGFMTCFALTHSKLFAAGIAGAPVTDWRDYDSIYTERYMGLPQDNPSGYAASSVVNAAKDLHGRLLIAHGGMDDNVHIRNTMKFVNALQQANKDFELMIYPRARHGWISRHYTKLTRDFIARTLGGPRDRVESSAPASDGRKAAP